MEQVQAFTRKNAQQDIVVICNHNSPRPEMTQMCISRIGFSKGDYLYNGMSHSSETKHNVDKSHKHWADQRNQVVHTPGHTA